MDCYTIKELVFEDPIFKRIEVSYLITMADSNRTSHYMEQLMSFRPTRRVIIVYNPGFKRCNKKGVTTPAHDIWHANQYIAHLAREEEHVLILEDDVQFLPVIYQKAQEIEDFMFARLKMPVAYVLGAACNLSYRMLNHPEHIKILTGGCAHAVIYNRTALQMFKNIRIRWFHDIALFGRTFYTYAPVKCCAIQELDTTTQNSQNWNFGNIAALTFDIIAKREAHVFFRRSHKMGEYGGLLLVCPCVILTMIIILVCTIRILRIQYEQKRRP